MEINILSHRQRDVHPSVAEEQRAKAVHLAVPRPTLTRHKATIAFASNKAKAPTSAAQPAADDEDATSALQLTMQLRGGSHDNLICLTCLIHVAWRLRRNAHVLMHVQ